MRLFSLLILSLIAFVLLGSALLLGLPGAFAEKALWITIIGPLVWLGFMFACYWTSKIWRVAALLLLISIGGGIMVLLTDTDALMAAEMGPD